MEGGHDTATKSMEEEDLTGAIATCPTGRRKKEEEEERGGGGGGGGGEAALRSWIDTGEVEEEEEEEEKRVGSLTAGKLARINVGEEEKIRE